MDINYEWLTKYFEVEPYDRIVLSNPERHVIEQGGVVLFALEDGVPVGTCALMKHTEVKFELAKMGVTESARGKGVGRMLVRAAIERARELGAETLILATSDLLEGANHLYKRLGFQPARLDILGPIPYKRHSIAMWMDLREGMQGGVRLFGTCRCSAKDSDCHFSTSSLSLICREAVGVSRDSLSDY